MLLIQEGQHPGEMHEPGLGGGIADHVLLRLQAEDRGDVDDATAMAEALYRWTAETVRKELKTELDFLVRFRAARAEMDEVVDMPDKEASLFIKLVVENAGRLSKAKRGRFPELSDDHIVRLEEIVRRNGLGEG